MAGKRTFPHHLLYHSTLNSENFDPSSLDRLSVSDLTYWKKLAKQYDLDLGHWNRCLKQHETAPVEGAGPAANKVRAVECGADPAETGPHQPASAPAEDFRSVYTVEEAFVRDAPYRARAAGEAPAEGEKRGRYLQMIYVSDSNCWNKCLDYLTPAPGAPESAVTVAAPEVSSSGGPSDVELPPATPIAAGLRLRRERSDPQLLPRTRRAPGPAGDRAGGKGPAKRPAKRARGGPASQQGGAPALQ